MRTLNALEAAVHVDSNRIVLVLISKETPAKVVAARKNSWYRSAAENTGVTLGGHFGSMIHPRIV